MDLLSRLPYEVFLRVLALLDSTQVFDSLFVCREWRTRLLQARLQPWLHFVTEDWNYEYRDPGSLNRDQAYWVLPAVSQHMESFTFNAPTFEGTGEFFTLFSTCLVPAIRSIALKTYAHARVGSLTDPIYTAIDHASHTLTSLSIVAPRQNLSLNRILQSCTHLTTLKIHANKILEGERNQLVIRRHDTALIEIDLSCSKRLSALEPLFRKSPQLRILRVHNCKIDFFTAIGGLCPNLAVLVVNTPEQDDPTLEPDFRKENYIGGNIGGGLRILILNSIPAIDPNMANRIQGSQDTLEYLHLGPGPSLSRRLRPMTVNFDWAHPFADVLFNNLTVLSATLDVTSVPAAVQAILQGCSPRLETLSLDTTDSTVERSVAGALDVVAQRITNLVNLKLDSVSVGGTALARQGALYTLMTNNVELGENSSLRKLELSSCRTLDPHVLIQATRIQTLNSLFVWGIEGMSGTDMDIIANNIAQSQRLTSLVIGMIPFTDDHARIVAGSRSLETVLLDRVMGLTAVGEEALTSRIDNVRVRR